MITLSPSHEKNTDDVTTSQHNINLTHVTWPTMFFVAALLVANYHQKLTKCCCKKTLKVDLVRHVTRVDLLCNMQKVEVVS